jgi:hypothetical protein
MKRRVMISSLLGISLCVILAFSMSLPAFADIGTDINSHWAWTAPTIDGTITTTPGEWSNASIRNFVFDMRDDSNNHRWYKNATLYVMNNYTYLFIAVRIYNDTYWALDSKNQWKGLGVFFNNNDNGTLGAGENGEMKTTWTGSPFYSRNDLYYNTSDGGYWDTDVNPLSHSGGTNDGAIAFSHTNPSNGALGNWTFEMKIPLVGSDPSMDFHITPAMLPKILGYKLEFEDMKNHVTGVYPDDASYPVDQTTNAATFGDLIIHPLYYLTIVATTGGTTFEAPGTYPYGYGTEVSVTAIAGLGYSFDHWTLDTVGVGATNPYTVLMDMNHTLKAFFKPIPKPVGGYSISLADKTSARSVAGYAAIFGVFAVVTAVVRRKKK